ncbi:hypothetical protein ACMFMF_006511 [Clarireedia jacksonii]
MNSLGLRLLASLEKDLAEKKALHFRGTAKVRTTQLKFLDPIRPVDQKIVDSLIRDFGAEGCLQHEKDCSVPAIVADIDYQQILSHLSLNEEDFKTKSILQPTSYNIPLHINLNCLHGQHRILAANSYLPSGDRWWLVDLFSPALDERVQQVLKEGYSYSTNYSGGEIFRQIRLCQFNGDKIGEDRWRARLSPNQDRDLNKLLKRRLLIQALDSILPFRGLWSAFHLGSMDIFLSIRCDEEIAHYIEVIRKTWSKIVSNDATLMEKLDEDTVKSIELRVPAVSRLDAEFVKEQMKTKALFRHTADTVLRRNIEHEVLELDYLIPSIFTLFKDLRFLEPVSKAIRAILPEPDDKKRTLRESLRFLYVASTSDGRSIDIQDSEMSFSTILGSFDSTFDLAIRQLYLCAMRYFTDPSNLSSKKNMNPIRQTINAPKRLLGFRLLNLSRRLGFQTLHIPEALEDPTERLLNDMLNTLPKEIFRFQGSPPTSLIEAFTEYLSSSTIVTNRKIAPSITSVGVGEPLPRRCGRACVTTSEDRVHLFLRTMHRQLGEYGSDGLDISSFFVKRCIYLAFFGYVHIFDEDTGNISSGTMPVIADRVILDEPGIGPESDRTIHNTEPVPEELVLQKEGDRSTHNTEPGVSMQSAPERRQEQPLANPTLQVDFIDVHMKLFGKVLFTKELVNGAAKHFAEDNYSLMDEFGKYWTWEECYDHLVDIEKKTIILVESSSQKRRRLGENSADHTVVSEEYDSEELIRNQLMGTMF